MKRYLILLSVTICALAASHAFATADTKWTGGDGNWSDPTMWTNGVPSETSSIAFNSTGGTISFGSTAYTVASVGEFINTPDPALVFTAEDAGGLTITSGEVDVGRVGNSTLKFKDGIYSFGGELYVGWYYQAWGSTIPATSRVDVVSADVTLASNMTLGRDHGVGELSLQGGSLAVSGEVNVGGNTDSAVGELTVSGGALTNGQIYIARGTTSTGTMTVYGGTVTATSNLRVGYQGVGVLNMEGGSITTTHSYAWVRQLMLAQYTNSTATVNLDGGRLQIAYVNVGESRDQTEAVSTAVINFNGGTLAADCSYWGKYIPDTEGLTLNILSGGAIIDVGEYNNTIDRAFTGSENDGGLKKYGSGKLTLTKGRTWNGPTKVYEGTLDMNYTELGGDIYIAPGASIVNATYASDANVLWYDPQGTTVGDTTLSLIADAGATYDDYSVSSLAATGGTVVVQNALDSLLCSAAVWYDPSDSSTLTTDDASVVSAISNKGLAGSSMDGEAYGATLPYIGDDGYLNFTNCLGFVSADSLYYSQDTGRALFAVASRFNNGDTGASDIQIFPVSWGENSQWTAYARFMSIECWSGSSPNYYVTEESPCDASNCGLSTATSGQMYVRSAVASNGLFTASAITYANSVVSTNSNTATYGSLTNGVSAYVYYGMRRLYASPSTGKLGEALAFDRGLSATETAVINQYLAAKWLDGDTAEPDVGTTTVSTLTLSNGAIVDFDGAAVAITTLSGSGVLTNFTSVIIGSTTYTGDWLVITNDTVASIVSDDVTIPSTWFDEYSMTNVNPSANAANTAYTIAQCYLAGLDPTDENAVFEMKGAVAGDGGRVASFTLPATPNGTAKVYYRTSADGTKTELTTSQNGSTVTVSDGWPTNFDVIYYDIEIVP